MDRGAKLRPSAAELKRENSSVPEPRADASLVSPEEEGYAHDLEMLGDYFTYLEMTSSSKRSPSHQESRSKWSPRLEKLVFFSRIEERYQKTQLDGDKTHLIRLFRQHGLDPQERLITAAVCYIQARCGEGAKQPELYDLLGEADRTRMIKLNRIFQSRSRLLKSGLVVQGVRGHYFEVRCFFVNREIQEKVLGLVPEKVRKPARSKGALKLRINTLESPQQVFNLLDQYVIGQEQAKQVLAVAVYNHALRVRGKAQIEKANILLAGPTGCGKTYLAETIARIMDVPLFIADATQYTETGYMGKNIDTVFEGLVRASSWNEKRAARGIIYIDEIDKIAATYDEGKHHTQRDVSGQSVQEELLRAVEGKELDGVSFPTRHVLFIVGGAFYGLGKSCRANRTIGFGQSQKGTLESGTPSVEDFVRFGMLPELMGRFPHQVFLSPLDVGTLRRILVDPKESLVKQYQNLFTANGMELEFTPEALDLIARKAASLNTGARALKSIMEEVLNPVMFRSFRKGGSSEKVLVSPEIVRGNVP